MGSGSRLRLLLLVVVFVGIAPANASAAPPVLVAVGHVDMHPTASWTLPLGVQPRVIEIATNPTQGTDGSFFSENVVVFDTLEDGQTAYVSSSSRLKTAITYYVHVSGYDSGCLPCPVREWSNVLTLLIPNVAPNLRSARWTGYRYLRKGSATLDVCDDEGDYRVLITQARLRRGRVVARASSTDTDNLLTSGCGSLFIDWSIPRKLIATGDLYRVTFTVIDSASARSRTLTSQARWKR